MKRPWVSWPGCSPLPMLAASILSPCARGWATPTLSCGARPRWPPDALATPPRSNSASGTQRLGPRRPAAAAFASDCSRTARYSLLLAKVRAVSSTEQGAPQIEAVTAIAKIGGDEGARASMTSSRPLPGCRDAGRECRAARILAGGRARARRRAGPLHRCLRRGDALARPLLARAPARCSRRGTADPRAQRSDAQTRTVAARGLGKALVDSARLDSRDAVAGLRRLLVDPTPISVSMRCARSRRSVTPRLQVPSCRSSPTATSVSPYRPRRRWECCRAPRRLQRCVPAHQQRLCAQTAGDHRRGAGGQRRRCGCGGHGR